ncbi:MAG TPA: hypothetical protein VEZ55_02450 [Chitinophagaceae bacterium]|nr:hypothetical protein [Chitinophagaceae bacterium]
MRKPNVPALNAVNLYQNGFLSVYSTPVHPGTVKERVTHRGTVDWMKVPVPQTGKAREGVCPGPSHTCDQQREVHVSNKKQLKICFISSGSLACIGSFRQ